MSLIRLSYLIQIAEKFDNMNSFKKEYRLASNAIDMAVNEAINQKGDTYANALVNIIRYASMLDCDKQSHAAKVLDVVVVTAQELWPSAHDRDDKYDFTSNNAQTLFQSLKDQPKANAIDPIYEGLQGKSMSLLTRHSPDYPGVPLMRVSDGVYQDTMTRKVYDFNHGWIGESGQSYPGGSVAHQTPSSSGYSGFNQVFESKNMTSRPR